ncbi:MAG: glycosyltransferase [Cyanobacteria bacterium]|nr:glycosyltransferase [Cyanobacteriota bacterium]
MFGTETAAAYLATHASRDVQDAFAAALSPVLQADLFRLAYLFHHGGIYADADDRCRKSPGSSPVPV